MYRVKKIFKILFACLFLFKSSRLSAESGVYAEKFSSVSLALEKKTGVAAEGRAENKAVASEVSLVRGKDLYALTRDAIDLIGGMKSIVRPKERVFIKPNYITGGLDGHDPVTSGEISHPLVVAAVAEECLRAGAKEVIIGEWAERPLKINFAGREGKEGAQVRRLVDLLNKKYGQRVYLINLMDYTTHFKLVPSKTKLRFLAIPNIVAEADVIISIPSLKTHHKPSPVSLGMKNFMGIMPSIFYGEPRHKLHEAGLHQVIVDINKALKPDLVVVDGSFGMEGRGASLYLGGKPVDVTSRAGGFIVIAGKDPVATDATATRLITKNWQPAPEDPDLGTPWYVHHLRMAYRQGLGNIDSSRISVKGEVPEDLSMNWEKSDDGVYPELPSDENR
ncbi:MAG: DUF362 domain-containing protein [Candidatus Omnitrophica bacterium]|nr:DUF362 domain-containing protein [Candidatus Omnitrophota bacterium]